MAKKISLREYQESVVARLQSSLAGGGGAASKLGIQAGNDLWLVDLQDASEVVAVPELAPVPLTHYWFRGVANVRGTLYSVVDLPMFNGGEPTMLTASSRLLLVNSKFIANSALLVNKMLGLRNIEQFQPEPVSEPLPAWQSGVYRDAEGKLWKALDMAALAANPQFLQVATI
ncbi:MAG: hypothetical protein RL210_2613 [Pseudomonadota bacterium]|jgi:twitching motility protein PilI